MQKKPQGSTSIALRYRAGQAAGIFDGHCGVGLKVRALELIL
jgi:hypothetical protein